MRLKKTNYDTKFSQLGKYLSLTGEIFFPNWEKIYSQ